MSSHIPYVPSYWPGSSGNYLEMLALLGFSRMAQQQKRWSTVDSFFFFFPHLAPKGDCCSCMWTFQPTALPHPCKQQCSLGLEMRLLVTQFTVRRRELGRGHCRPWEKVQGHLVNKLDEPRDPESDLESARLSSPLDHAVSSCVGYDQSRAIIGPSKVWKLGPYMPLLESCRLKRATKDF